MHWNMHATVRWWHLSAALLLFGFTGWSTAAQVARLAQSNGRQVQFTIWDACVVAFAGPSVTDGSFFSMLIWFIPHMLFFYMIGDVAYGELVQRGCAVVPAIGSRRQWWWGKIVTLGLLAMGYAVLGVGAALLGALTVLPWSWVWNGEIVSYLSIDGTRSTPVTVTTLLMWVLGLFASTLFTTALWQTMFAMLLRRSFYGLVAVVMIALCSWLLGIDNPNLVRWLPGSQSMLLRHTFLDPAVPGFSFQWSLVYNTVLALVAISVGRWYVVRMDIFGQPVTERH